MIEIVLSPNEYEILFRGECFVIFILRSWLTRRYLRKKMVFRSKWIMFPYQILRGRFCLKGRCGKHLIWGKIVHGRYICLETWLVSYVKKQKTLQSCNWDCSRVIKVFMVLKNVCFFCTFIDLIEFILILLFFWVFF